MLFYKASHDHGTVVVLEAVEYAAASKAVAVMALQVAGSRAA